MNTYVWRRWSELDLLVRYMALANRAFMRRVSDAPPRAVHAYALMMRSPFWAAMNPLACKYQCLADDTHSKQALLRNPANALPVLELSRFLDTHALPDLIVLALPTAPARLLEALDRCGDEVRKPAFYDQLLAAMSTPEMAEAILSRSVQVDERALAALGRARHLSPIIRQAYIRGKVHLHLALAFQRLFDRVVELHGEGLHAVFEHALSKWNRENPHKHIDRLLDRLPAAPPPWPGNDCLTPILSTAELKAVSRQFKNCLSGMRLEQVLGTHCFYAWNAAGATAVLSVRNEGECGWNLDELRGPGNSPVPEDLVEQVKLHLSAAGIGVRTSLERTIRAFGVLPHPADFDADFADH